MSTTLVALLITAAGAILSVLGAYFKGQRAGRNEVKVEQAKKDDAVAEEFHKIDARAPDLDAALGRLRDRSSKQ